MKFNRTTGLVGLTAAIIAGLLIRKLIPASSVPVVAIQPSPLALINSLPETWLVDSEVTADYLDMTWQADGDSPVASQSESCTNLTHHEIRVIFGAQSDERKQQVQKFLDANPVLLGSFCINPRNRRVWMSQRVPAINTAVKFFDKAIAAGLVHPVNVTKLP